MTGFSESWLRDYNARRAAVGGPSRLAGTPIRLTLRRPTITLNQLVRMHWRARGNLAQSIASEISAQLPPFGAPFRRSVVTFSRFSMQECDKDGLYGGVKLYLDTLLPFSKRHPHGLGVILDDDPKHCALDVVQVKVPTSREQRTEIVIEPLPAA